MFFVFGPSGQMFRGGPDALMQVAPVRRVARTQALHTRSVGSPQDEPVQVQLPPANRPPEPISPRVQDAVSAYVQTAQGPQERQKLTRVRDVMSTGVLTVPPEVRVNDAWHTLAQYHVAQAPVVNAMGLVVGMLLRADMAPLDLLPEPGAVQAAIELAGRPVSEVMVSPVPTVSADTELRRVARVLLDADLPGLPVTDEFGALSGFISRNDILQAVAADPPLDIWSGGRPVVGYAERRRNAPRFEVK
ncbi:CBS domain-containing protein [Simplicispira psychrophila]|uniref:CBS domain-containing protein n=1 Tax=Simplicispira psychrophila TaxID=80882 RepID=UPI0006919B22|nr:CBS domain-containing protein [Simplicispira psychrophila]